MSDYQRVATVDEISPGSRKSVIVDDRSVLLIRVGDDYFAIEDLCTHDGQPLADGKLESTEIECGRHGGRFSLGTGKATRMPAITPVATFSVEIRGSDIFIGPQQ